ncbi:hypothetical protein HPB49_008845 [Dermacentor silvarum]|uniref:Uncharacterized protein n=1 Tax=Dermacentor silvarum TaxID=543639 RepID=A0ACB8CJY2_DERSI|nr:hypothetical protein HPB49_008845 [Dermacentor silvarum]
MQHRVDAHRERALDLSCASCPAFLGIRIEHPTAPCKGLSAFLNDPCQYMVILFLLFVVQFSVACACLAMTEDQERELASQGWKKASPAVRAQAERLFRCCGFERNASDPTAELQCEHVPTCCPPQEIPPNGTCECEGCWSALHQAIRNGLKITGGIGMFFSFTEFIGVWLTVRYRNQKDPRANPSAFL